MSDVWSNFRFKVALEMADGLRRETTCYAADEIGALYTVAAALASSPERPRVVRAHVEAAPEGSGEVWNVIVPPPVDPRAVSPALVDRYRAADAAVARARRFGSRNAAPRADKELNLARLDAACVLAEDVVKRADAVVTADASSISHLRTLVQSASYTMGNPMSGLGGNTTVQAALGALREAETLIDATGPGAQETGPSAGPFPGAEVRWVDCGGKMMWTLCVEGTDVTVALVLALLANRGVDEAPTVEQIVARHKIDYDTTRKCLRGLAGWLKAQQWTAGEPEPSAQRYSAMSAEEFADLRRVAAAGSAPRMSVSEVDRLTQTWAQRLSRALNVIERVTDERDRCTKARLAQMTAAWPAAAVDLWRTLASAADKDAESMSKCDHYSEGLATGKALAYRDAAATLEALLAAASDVEPQPLAGSETKTPAAAAEPPSAASEDGPTVENRLCDLAKDTEQLFALLDKQEANQEIDEKRAREKRCGTCAEGCPYGHDQVRTPCNHYADSPNRPDGPPWPDCRFWKPLEAK